MMRQRWGLGTVVGISGVVAALIAACAGSDIPPISNDERDAIEDIYGDEVGSAGSGMVGGAGSGMGGASMVGGGGAAGAPPVTGGAGGGNSSGGSGGGSGNNGTPCDAPATIFVPSCGDIGCHNANSPFGDFGASETAAEAFLDAPSDYDPACGLLIDSANPEDSLLLTKVNNTHGANCGQQMPLSGGFLEPDEEACILSWLNQFAD